MNAQIPAYVADPALAPRTLDGILALGRFDMSRLARSLNLTTSIEDNVRLSRLYPSEIAQEILDALHALDHALGPSRAPLPAAGGQVDRAVERDEGPLDGTAGGVGVLEHKDDSRRDAHEGRGDHHSPGVNVSGGGESSTLKDVDHDCHLPSGVFAQMPPEMILVPEKRARATQAGTIDALVHSIRTEGLLQPLVIDRSMTLISGAHRLAACRILGLKVIPVHIVEFDDVRRELAEIDENLVRAELGEFERCQHLARRKALYEHLHPETRRGGGPGKPGGGKVAARTPDTGDLVPSFADDTASKTGRGPSTIREEAAIGARIVEPAAVLLREHPAAKRKGELKKLAKMTPAAQVEYLSRDSAVAGAGKSAELAASPTLNSVGNPGVRVVLEQRGDALFGEAPWPGGRVLTVEVAGGAATVSLKSK